MITHKAVSLADQIFERLEEDILAGKYKKGSILTEIGLSEEMGVSRTPVREALKRLEQEHIVENSGKGVSVLGISDTDAGIMFDIRIKVEGMAAASCAKNITKEQLAELNEILELQEFYTSKLDAEKIKSLDSEFHAKIYECSGSSVYYDTLKPLHNKLQKVRKTSLSNPERAGISCEEHRSILDALSEGNPEKADLAMEEHIKNARQYFESALEGQK